MPLLLIKNWSIFSFLCSVSSSFSWSAASSLFINWKNKIINWKTVFPPTEHNCGTLLGVLFHLTPSQILVWKWVQFYGIYYNTIQCHLVHSSKLTGHQNLQSVIVCGWKGRNKRRVLLHFCKMGKVHKVRSLDVCLAFFCLGESSSEKIKFCWRLTVWHLQSQVEKSLSIAGQVV